MSNKENKTKKKPSAPTKRPFNPNFRMFYANGTDSIQSFKDLSDRTKQSTDASKTIIKLSETKTSRKNPFPDLLQLGPSKIDFVHPEIVEIPNHSLPRSVKTFQGSKPKVLSQDQSRIKHEIIDCATSVFFTGRAGTGKSFLLRDIIETLKKSYSRSEYAVTASTGIAAYNIGGVTLHSFAGVGLGKAPVNDLIKIISKNPKTLSRWSDLRVLIVDEVSMITAEFFDKLNAIAKNVRGNSRPFGGIQLILCGDFLQLPPPSKDSKFIFESVFWSEFKNLKMMQLETVYRQTDPQFINILNELRMGSISSASIDVLKKLDRPQEINDNCKPTKLFPLRREVDAVNKMELMKLQGKGTIFVANDFAIDPRDLRKLDDSLMAPNSIELRVGAQVMLIKNLHQSGLFNGMIGTVKSIETDSVYVSFSSDGFIITHCITRELFELERNGQVFAKRSQLPLILSYAMSIHKSQGQTLKYVNVDLERVFESGQAYVALSRCTSLAGLQVKNFHPDKVKVNSKVLEFYQKYNLN